MAVRVAHFMNVTLEMRGQLKLGWKSAATAAYPLIARIADLRNGNNNASWKERNGELD